MRTTKGLGWAILLGVGTATIGVQSQRAGDDLNGRLVQPVATLGAVDHGVVGHAVKDATVRDARAALAARSRTAGRGRVLVKFREGVASAVRAAAVREVSPRTIAVRPTYADFDVLSVGPDEDPEVVARELAQRPDVEYAQADYPMVPHFTPNDPFYSRQWNLADLGMEQAWDINRGADSSIIVAVLDSGLAFEDAIGVFEAGSFVNERGVAYPALGRITVPFAAATDLASAGRIVAPRDFIYDDTKPYDLEGHGTHVAGTIAQLTNNGSGVAGMAFNVRVMPIKVIAGEWDAIFNAPNDGTDETVARGIRYAAENGARVINMSLGRQGPPAPAVEAAMRDAVSRGVFISVSAGNSFEAGNPLERVAEIAGRLDGAMAVAATGREKRRAFYSSTASHVEISAPGGDRRSGGVEGMILQQTYNPDFTDTFFLPPARYVAPRFDQLGFVYYSGTSMAAPHVAGLAALLMEQGITKPAAIEAAIKAFATDLGATGRDNEFGHGLINPRATLRGLGVIR